MKNAEHFTGRVRDILSRAKASGLSVAELCRRAGVSRGTPEKWLKVAPKTIRVLDALETAVVDAEAKR